MQARGSSLGEKQLSGPVVLSGMMVLSALWCQLSMSSLGYKLVERALIAPSPFSIAFSHLVGPSFGHIPSHHLLSLEKDLPSNLEG